MIQFDLFTGTVSNAPRFQPPPSEWHDASLDHPVQLGRYWIALWTNKIGWTAFQVFWDRGKFYEVVHRYIVKEKTTGIPVGAVDVAEGESLQHEEGVEYQLKETFPRRAFFGVIPLSILQLYWCEISRFANEEEVLESLNSVQNFP